MRDFDDEDDFEEPAPGRGAPTGRVYVHKRCGGQTLVSGGDYTHLCDPFWPCTATYCCECADFAPLSEVRWADTKEPLSRYRSRLRRETPGLIKAWRYGVGLLPGAIPGAVLGLAVALAAQAPRGRASGFALLGALLGAVVCYLLGIPILNRIYDIDYRRMR